MKVNKKEYSDHLHMWVIACPLCKEILASAVNEDMLPESMICSCDANGNKMPAFELFDRDGNTWIRRNKYPRFIGQVTMDTLSIENIELLDDCTDATRLASLLRKARVFLLRCKKR